MKYLETELIVIFVDVDTHRILLLCGASINMILQQFRFGADYDDAEDNVEGFPAMSFYFVVFLTNRNPKCKSVEFGVQLGITLFVWTTPMHL